MQCGVDTRGHACANGVCVCTCVTERDVLVSAIHKSFVLLPVGCPCISSSDNLRCPPCRRLVHLSW